MNIQNALRKSRNKMRRKQAHITRKADEIDIRFVQRRDNLAVIRFALQSFGGNDASGKPARACPIDSRCAFAIADHDGDFGVGNAASRNAVGQRLDRKSTRLNSSHSQISYAVFCLKKKKLLSPSRS